MITSINPYNQEVVFTCEEFTSKQVLQSIEKAYDTFKSWRNSPLSQKCLLIQKVADLLENQKEKWARTITLEMGKPISQSIAEIEKCAWLCRYYAKHAAELLQPTSIKTDAKESYVRYDPLGVILGVMPWNYPFWQVFRFAIPTLLAGNTVLLKHASNVMKSAFHIEEIFTECNFPIGCFKNLSIKSNQVENIIRHPYVKGVSLTGSKKAGSAVAKIAAEEIKPSLLELGGNNALVVFEDCNFEKTILTCINARYQNTGQSCIAGKRLLLQESIAKKFLFELENKIKELKSGNPLDKDTFIGYMVHTEAAKVLEEQLNDTLQKGGKLHCGGKREGTYFPPTLVSQVSEDMRVFSEETFGPLLACTTFKDEKEALYKVNQSNFGLGVSLFTCDTDRINRLIPQLEEGAVFVNELVKSDPRLPFGGVKNSGYGRELSKEGILSFVNKKTVFIA